MKELADHIVNDAKVFVKFHPIPDCLPVTRPVFANGFSSPRGWKAQNDGIPACKKRPPCALVYASIRRTDTAHSRIAPYQTMHGPLIGARGIRISVFPYGNRNTPAIRRTEPIAWGMKIRHDTNIIINLAYKYVATPHTGKTRPRPPSPLSQGRPFLWQ